MKIILIGGSSGVGKTAVANEIAQHLSLSLLLVDDVRIALQAVTNSVTHPALHVFLNYSKEEWQNAESIFADWIWIGKALLNPISAIISHHIAVPGIGKLIIEGDGIIPIAYNRTAEKDHVRSVFIVEQNEKKLLLNLKSRGRGFCERDNLEQETFAHASWLYGQWISQEAKKLGLAIIDAQPQETLFERFLSMMVK